MQNFRGKVAVITGRRQRHRSGLARKAASEGHAAGAADIEQGALDGAAAELRDLGVEVLPVRTDVSQLADVRAGGAGLRAFRRRASALQQRRRRLVGGGQRG